MGDVGPTAALTRDLLARLSQRWAYASRSPTGALESSLTQGLSLARYDDLRDFVGAVDRCLVDLNQAQHVREPIASAVWATALSGSLPVLLLCRHGESELAVQRLYFLWKAALVALTGVAEGHWEFGIREGERVARLATEDELGACVASYSVAVAERIAAKVGGDALRVTVARLRAYLALDDADVTRALGASPDTAQEDSDAASVRQLATRATASAAGAALDRLLGLFKPERLPEVIRRPADLFGGQRALDWILEGRIADVADRYDMALSYQA